MTLTSTSVVTDRLSVTVSPTLTNITTCHYLTLLPLPCISGTLMRCLVSSLYFVLWRSTPLVHSRRLSRFVRFFVRCLASHATPCSLRCVCVASSGSATPASLRCICTLCIPCLSLMYILVLSVVSTLASVIHSSSRRSHSVPSASREQRPALLHLSSCTRTLDSRFGSRSYVIPVAIVRSFLFALTFLLYRAQIVITMFTFHPFAISMLLDERRHTRCCKL
jgi:hypothetical protein